MSTMPSTEVWPVSPLSEADEPFDEPGLLRPVLAGALVCLGLALWLPPVALENLWGIIARGGLPEHRESLVHLVWALHMTQATKAALFLAGLASGTAGALITPMSGWRWAGAAVALLNALVLAMMLAGYLMA